MKPTNIIVAVALAFTAALAASSAMAQNARSFVSGQGVDSNACTLAAPCRTFAFALTRTNAGGEILTLNPAGYGPVTIDKSISIISSPGVGGVNMLAAGNVITINAGPNDIVSLRGLNIDGLGIATTGIVFISGKSLTIEDCVIRHMTGSGIFIVANNTAGSSNHAYVSNSVLSDNSIGIEINNPHVGMSVTVNRTEIVGNDIGIDAFSNHLDSGQILWLSVNDSIIAASSLFGLRANSFSNGSFITAAVTRSSIVDGAGAAILSSGTGTAVQVNQTTVANNASGWSTASGGGMSSWGNNAFSDKFANGDSPIGVRNPL